MSLGNVLGRTDPKSLFRRLVVAVETFAGIADEPDNPSGNTGNMLWVFKDGNDTRAERGKFHKPFQTLKSAVLKAHDGDLIILGPGLYEEKNILLLAQTYRVYFSPGAFLKSAVAEGEALFKTADVDPTLILDGAVHLEVPVGSGAGNCILADFPMTLRQTGGFMLNGTTGAAFKSNQTSQLYFRQCHFIGSYFGVGVSTAGTVRAYNSIFYGGSAEAPAMFNEQGDDWFFDCSRIIAAPTSTVAIDSSQPMDLWGYTSHRNMGIGENVTDKGSWIQNPGFGLD